MTANAERPPPMVGPDIDLRGLEYMPLLGAKLFTSDFNLDATDAEFRRALMLWWQAWNQQPAASLPNSDRSLAKLAGFEDERSAAWRKLRDRVLYGFVLCSDGRLYHPVLAKQALIAWERRMESRAELDGDKERKRRERRERAQMFEALKGVGVTPVYNVRTGDLRKLVTQHVPGFVAPPVTVTSSERLSEDVTVTVTAKTRRDGTVIQEGAQSTVVARPRTEPPEAEGHEPTPAGRVCRLMRLAGLQQTNPGDPRLLALLGQGATDAEFEGVARDAVGKSKGWAWALAALEGRRKDAAEIALAALPPPAHERAAQTEFERTQAYLAEQRADPEAVKAAARLARERRDAAAAEGQATP